MKSDAEMETVNCALSSGDITGQKFFLLTALKRAGSNQYGWFWLCVCDCGRTREVLFNHLKTGHTKYCAPDCPVRAKLLKKAAQSHAARPDIKRKKLGGMYAAAKRAARLKGENFTLNFEEWVKMGPR